MIKIEENRNEGLDVHNTIYDRATQLIFKDILNDILEYGLRVYIEQGVHYQFYTSIEDGINALYRKSNFYFWLLDTEKFEAADLIKREVEKIEYEEKEL